MDFHPQSGRILLVGAGPGAADLLTLRAVRALAAADVVVHDGLVGDEVMALIPAHARRISVAKRRARHTLAQDEIGDLLVAEARAGHTVVRLKGGDPFIFGRGGEEVDAALAAGVPVVVIPGISAANGAAASTLMPLTHRDHASMVSFVAGECLGLAEQNWAGLAGKGRTLVIYMGIRGAAAIQDGLLQGLPASTPAAIVENASLPAQRYAVCTLGSLHATLQAEQLSSPSVLVVGDVLQGLQAAQSDATARAGFRDTA